MAVRSVEPVKSESVAVRQPKLYTATERLSLDQSFLARSPILGYYQVFGNIAVFVALLLLASVARCPWQYVPLCLAIGFSQHRLFFPTHDCIHYSLFPTKTENRAFGALLSSVMGTSFDAMRNQHLEHHADFGLPEDPGAADYFVRFRTRRELAVFLLGPLVGSILFQRLRDYLLRPGRNVEASEERQPGHQIGLMGAVRAYGTILCIQAGICALLTRGFNLHELWRYPVFYILPLVTIFLFLVRLRMFLEHGSLNYKVCDYLEGKRPTARSIYASWIERLLLCGSDFNFHHEHHLYPGVPGWQLPRLHRRLAASGFDPEDIRQTYFQSLGEIWKNLAKDRLSDHPRDVPQS